MFHCLVIKVLCLSVSQTARLLYHIHQRLSSTFFKFFRGVLMFVCRSQATCLLYHMFVSLSTIIFVFFKTFQIVCSKESILCDSSVRISRSNRAVNTFFKFFPETFSSLAKTLSRSVLLFPVKNIRIKHRHCYRHCNNNSQSCC